MNNISHLKSTPRANCGSCTNLRNPIKDFSDCKLKEKLDGCIFGEETLSLLKKPRYLISGQLLLLKEVIDEAKIEVQNEKPSLYRIKNHISTLDLITTSIDDIAKNVTSDKTPELAGYIRAYLKHHPFTIITSLRMCLELIVMGKVDSAKYVNQFEALRKKTVSLMKIIMDSKTQPHLIDNLFSDGLPLFILEPYKPSS